MIDLHLHTTASDGALSPPELVRRAHAAGLSVIAITDHDTMSGACAARDAARQRGVELVPAVEISSVDRGRDIHMLAYFIDPESPDLLGFLGVQRTERLRRLSAMGERLATLGCAIDIDPILETARSG